MNTQNCPVTNKVMDKLVSQLQDILVLLDAQDKSARLDFLKFRAKVIKQYNTATFNSLLVKAKGDTNVKDLYSGASV